LEQGLTVARVDAGKAVVLPKEAKDVPATMTWAGDVAEMIARLLFLPAAMRETYTVSTAETKTWGEIAAIYEELIGMRCVWVDKADYLRIICGDGDQSRARRQLEYDRLFSRVIDNTKILSAVGMKQSELKPLKEGLAYELSRRKGALVQGGVAVAENERMDAYLAALSAQ
jgi:nucleoside-diphosphate-sugar epimerase